MEDNKKVLATVNGIEITEEIVDSTIAKFPPDRRAYFESEFGRAQLLDQIVNVELVNAYGLEIGVQNDDFYRTQLEQAEKDIRFNATMNRIMGDVAVTDEEILDKYNSNPAEFSGPESVSAMHILVDSEEQANEIRNQIINEEKSFEDAAKEYSSCPSKEAGGDLGSFGRGMMVPEFENVAFDIDLDLVSEPVQTQFGYHLIKVYDRKNAELQSFDDVKDTIKNALMQEKQMEKYNELIQELRDKYFSK